MNQDFKELLAAFIREKARFLIVGGYAVIRHSEPRYTKDLDIWVSPDAANAERVFRGLERFGAPLDGLSANDFSKPEYFYTMGRPPGRVDILMNVTGVEFEECWQRRSVVTLGDMEVSYISRDDLITNKEAVGRLQDLADAEKLRETDPKG